MKKTLMLLVIFGSLNSHAQGDLVNLQKYWHYRHRLVNYFMVVGEGPGKSLPADIRNQNGNHELHWGETLIFLGYYVGVLATEYRLLQDNSQATDRTLTELFYALKAIDRLDEKAEVQWELPGSKNGFLIRDDVPENFVMDNSNQLNQGITPNQWGPCSAYICGSGRPGWAVGTVSDFKSLKGKSEMSQEQAYGLLLGLALANHYLDAGKLSFIDNSSGTQFQKNEDLKAMAFSAADRLLDYMKSHYKGNGNYSHWSITFPDNNKVVKGGLLNGYAYALARAGNQITKKNYKDAYSESFETLWQNQQESSIIRCYGTGQDEAIHYMAMTLAALSNAWKYPKLPSQTAKNSTPDRILQHGDYDAGSTKVCNWPDHHYGWDVFYGLLWDCFYGNSGTIGDLCKARDILNSANWDGPFNHNASDKANFGWCSTRRFVSDAPQQETGKSGFEGNYNGLDYMLLFNLYYIHASKQFPIVYVPQSGDDFISGAYPFYYGGEYYGTISDPWRIDMPHSAIHVNSLEVTSGKAPTYGIGDLTMYSGPNGIFLSNTTIMKDASFFAYWTDLNVQCTPSASYYFDPLYYNKNSYGNFDEPLPPYVMSGDFSQEGNIQVYPNPNNGVFTLGFSDGEQFKVKVYNDRGQEIYSAEHISNKTQIDISACAKGIYLIKVEGSGKVLSKKIQLY